MANPEHVAILEQGVWAWNKWRRGKILLIPDLRGVDLRGADLRGISFFHVDLTGADLREADLTGANLIDANLRRAILTQANLSNTKLRSAIFASTMVAGVEFSDAYIFQTEIIDVNLSTAIGLEDVIHGGPSSVGIDTIIRSRGQIPEVFLRGAGVPDSMITYMQSLTQEDVIQFQTCFISYTEADDLISERLYNDLQATGVRCWRWREDAPWGKTLMKSVDEAVRMYDKLVVICSEKSLQAPPVIREIERALQKEDQLAAGGQGGEVLFPIRLDDYIFEEWEHHRKADVVAKNVGDFQEWEDPKKYKDAFDRLLRDLREE